jgi:hypothetical protein
MTDRSNIDQNLIGLTLSIVLAAAVALALQSLTTYIPEEKTIEWAFASFLAISATLGIIYFILGGKIDKTDKLFYFKIILIILSSMTAFAFSRLAYFASEKTLNNTYIGNFYAALLFPGFIGASCLIQSWYLQKENVKNFYWVMGLVILIIVGIFLFTNTFMKIGVPS